MTPRQTTLESLRCHLSPACGCGVCIVRIGQSTSHMFLSHQFGQPIHMSRQRQGNPSRITDGIARRSYLVAIESLWYPSTIISPHRIPLQHIIPSPLRLSSIRATSLELKSTGEFVQACCFRNRSGNEHFCRTVAHCKEERNSW